MTQPTDSLNVFLVGGAVRDQLLERLVKDRDYLVVGASQEQMLSLGFLQVGKDFPVFLHPQTKEEYALARTERKQGHGYTGFTCYAEPDVTIEQDLLRRDLTINAMALSTSGELIDPYQGQQDLEKRLLRHVSPAFVEDPLRVLRVARFAARYHSYGFCVADETMTLMQQLAASGELSDLSAERVFSELERSLTEAHPEVFFEVLRACGALKVLWPELDALWGVPNPAKWHPEICSGIHTMMVLQQSVKLSNKIEVRFAALCHDLGKGITPAEQWPSHRGHESGGLPLVEKSCKRFKVPNHFKTLALKVCQYHLHCHKAFELRPQTILKVFNALDIWRKPELLTDFVLCCTADARGRTHFEEAEYRQADYLLECGTKARAVIAKNFVEQGLKGSEIKQAMESARLDVITQTKAKWMQALEQCNR